MSCRAQCMDQKQLFMNSHLTHLTLGTPHGLEARHIIGTKSPGAPGDPFNRLSYLGEPGENPSWLILPENYRLITEFRSRTTLTGKSCFPTKALLVAVDSSPARTLLLAHRADLLRYDPHLRRKPWIDRPILPSFTDTDNDISLHSVRRMSTCNKVPHTCAIHDES